jgi:magnesium-transporting ATPase (P-type)
MKGDLDLAALKKAQPRIEAIPFDSKLKYMATLNRNQDGEAFIHLKGAPEQVLDLCTRQCGEDGKSADLDRDYWSEKLDTMTARAERVIAVARRRVPAGTSSLTHDDIEKISSNGEGFVLLGLFGFIDPPREEAIAAVKHAHEAGIRVKMITGDHPATAIAIGKLLGLDTGEGAITGRDIETMDDAALRKAVTRTDIFARTTPDHKLRLVEALQAEGELVAMTGDGVNDAPALKTADIGVAMGDKGTEAAKEASGMVLADDNFATIAHAIEEGRTVFDNLRKAIVFVLPTSVAQGLAVMVAILFALTLPITPLQILWVNMITAVTLAIPLAFERPEANVMRRPPRPRGEGLLTPFLIWRIGFVSALLLAAIYIMFLNEYQPGIDEAVARTLAVNVLVMGEAVYLINSRHLLRPSWTWRGLTGNRYVLYGIAAVMAFQMIFTYWGPMQTLFGTAPLTLMHWGYVIGLALVVFVAVEIEKLVIRTAYRHSRQRGTRDTTLSAAEA